VLQGKFEHLQKENKKLKETNSELKDRLEQKHKKTEELNFKITDLE